MFKETNDGQTHFFGDQCGMPEHNPPGDRIERLTELIDEEKEFVPLVNKINEIIDHINQLQDQIEKREK